MRFDLIYFDGPFFFGIAIDRIEGAIDVTNQIGGTACEHPTTRGLLVPLPYHWQPDRDPLRGHCLDYYRPDLVERFLRVMQLDVFFMPIALCDVPSFEGSDVLLAEAWIPVRVRSQIDSIERAATWLKSFAGERMVLTYQNSD